MIVKSAVNGIPSYTYNHNYIIGQKYHIVIRQKEDQNGAYIFEVIIDGTTVHTVENTLAQRFDSVKLYASNPWMDPFTSELGTLENLLFNSGCVVNSTSYLIIF